MDQATFTNKGFLRHKSERGEDSNLDRYFYLRAGSDRQKASEIDRSEPLHNFTDFECQPVWKSIFITVA